MSDDRFPLDAAAKAYRETFDGEVDDTAARRTALLARRDAALDGSQRRAWLAAAVVLVTLAAIPTAWALTNGFRFDEPELASPAPREVSMPRRAPPPPAELAPPAPPTPVEPPATEPAPTEITAPVEVRTPAGERLVDPRERRAYEAAHALHFEARDAAGAVRAWQAYLAEYPDGRFVPEARYNRALSLVRLGRRDEAIEALVPFRDGAFGSYRRREAGELLEALGETP